jgi:hypothetical protein
LLVVATYPLVTFEGFPQFSVKTVYEKLYVEVDLGGPSFINSNAPLKLQTKVSSTSCLSWCASDKEAATTTSD